MAPSTKKLITIKLAAEILGLSKEVLRDWDKSGKLKANRNHNNNYRLYDITQLQKFAQEYHLKLKSDKRKLTDD